MAYKVKTPVKKEKVRYPFSNMQVEQFIEVNPDAVENVRKAASIYGKRKGISFSVRKVAGKEIYHCTRIA